MLKLNYSFAVLCLGLVSSMVACTPAPKNPKQPSFPSTEETQWEEKRKRLLKEAENQTRPNNSTQGVPYVNPYEAQQRAENARAEESRKNAEAQRAKLDQSFKEALAKLEEVGLSFVEQGGTIVKDGFAEHMDQLAAAAGGMQFSGEEGEIARKVKELIDTYVKPAVESDGGNIEFKSYENGRVYVIMQGSCSGCPSSSVTLKSGIEGMLKRMVPEVTEVLAEGV